MCRRVNESVCRGESEIAEVGHVGDVDWDAEGAASVKNGVCGGEGTPYGWLRGRGGDRDDGVGYADQTNVQPLLQKLPDMLYILFILCTTQFDELNLSPLHSILHFIASHLESSPSQHGHPRTGFKRRESSARG